MTTARVGRSTLGRNHTCRGPIETFVFMPAGTQTSKGLTREQLHQLNRRIILGNTYHLGHRSVNSSRIDLILVEFHSDLELTFSSFCFDMMAIIREKLLSNRTNLRQKDFSMKKC